MSNGDAFPKRKPGRPPGKYGPYRPREYSNASVQKLKKLNFDPLEKLVETYKDICRAIRKEENATYKDGTRVNRVSTQLAILLATKQKLLNDLMRFGYARVPEVVQQENLNTPPLLVTLTDNSTFSIGTQSQDGSDVIDVEPEYEDSDDLSEDEQEDTSGDSDDSNGDGPNGDDPDSIEDNMPEDLGDHNVEYEDTDKFVPPVKVIGKPPSLKKI